MKYDEKSFNSSVEEYKKILGDVKAKSFLVVFDISNKESFFSIAPLSRAIHELEGDMHVIGIDGKSEALEAVKDVWSTYKAEKGGASDNKAMALRDFIDEIEKKDKGKFERLFESPDYSIEAKEKGFEGDFILPFKSEWFKEHKEEELIETCTKIWKDVYDLQDGERVSIGFVLVQNDEMLGHPLEDYLDSYAISWKMMLSCKNIAKISMGASTQRNSMLATAEKISELKTVLAGCELCKDVDEVIFIKFKKLSKLLDLDRIKPFFVVFHNFNEKVIRFKCF